MESRKDIENRQIRKLNYLLQVITPGNQFYQKKLIDQGFHSVGSLSDFKSFPFTLKRELTQDQLDYPPYGTVLTYPLDTYVRIHQTSGTTGNPMYWLDTEPSWHWFAGCWKTVFEAAGATAQDRIYFPFSFGPFVGFWSGWEGARLLGALAIPGGGQSTQQRLKNILNSEATVIVCTPTYALHMAAEAEAADVDIRSSKVRLTIHAGEPGASIPSTKKKIEEAWGAKCFDHAGATEAGAYGFECLLRPCGIHLNEEEFIAEIIDPETGRDADEGERGELVVTNLGRLGSPIIRYRTGDLVQPNYGPCPCGRPFVLLEGGILGRVDDMVVVRGVNVYPGAVEGILREFPDIEEFRIDVFETEGLSELKITVEPKAGVRQDGGLEGKVQERIRERLNLRARVEVAVQGSLPRFELKARRFFRHRSGNEAANRSS
ncbi:MAG: AMP-binding protein [Candidatus Binatia bacterium]|nr:AMP-binding protein [Candidatus Binatia bacterium]